MQDKLGVSVLMGVFMLTIAPAEAATAAPVLTGPRLDALEAALSEENPSFRSTKRLVALARAACGGGGGGSRKQRRAKRAATKTRGDDTDSASDGEAAVASAYQLNTRTP